MRRFFRTAYSATLVYLCLTLFVVLITRVRMPFLTFSCLYFGLLICLLPDILQHLSGKEWLFYTIGALTAMLGFLPLALWHCPISHWVIHLLGIIAAAVCLSVLRHGTTYNDFMSKYQFTVALLLILIGFVSLSTLTGIYRNGEASERSGALSLALNNIVPYVIVLLASGILLLRSLRAQIGMADERAFNRRQLRDTLIFVIIVSIVFAVDPFVYLKKAAIFLFNDVLRPATDYLAYLFSLFIKAISIQRPPSEQTELPPEEPTEQRPIPLSDPAETDTEHYYVEGNDLTRTIAYIFIAAAMLILLYILFLQVRKLVRNLKGRNQNRGHGYPNETIEMLPAEESSDRVEKPKRRSADPRERMRYLYGEFLRYLKKRRIRVDNTNTCGEIQHHAKKNSVADSSTLADFTVLYEQARYDLNETPTESDARAMKSLLDKIKNRP